MAQPFSPHASTPVELRERLELERAGQPFLAWRDAEGHQQLRALPANGGRITIGRRSDNDVPLSWDSQVSRVHAIVESAGRDWVVVDDGLSQNGTWIGVARVAGHRRLRHGDVVRAGAALITFFDPRRGDSGATSIGHELRNLMALTPMQQRVLVALCRPFADGRTFATPATNQEIAAELCLSLDGVKTHMRTLFRKFAIEDLPQNQKRLQLAEAALRSGLVVDPGPER